MQWLDSRFNFTKTALILLLLGASPAVAQAGSPLTLDEALRLAEEQSPIVRRARAERAQVAARDVGARLLLPTNPVVAVGAGPRREGGVEGMQVTAHVEQTLEIFAQRSTRRETVARAVSAADARQQLAVVETRARVKSAYLGALLARAQVDTQLRREELARRLHEAVKTRVETGAASDVDLHLAALEVGRAARDRVDAELEVEASLAMLRPLLGLPPGSALALATPLERPPGEARTLAALVDLARARRADLEALARTEKAIDAEIVRLRREALPSPTVFLDVQRDLPGILFVGGGIAVPLPTWRRNQGEIALARAERARVETELEAAAREAGLEVERAYNLLLTRDRQARILDTEVVPAAESALDLITQGWRAGKFDLFRVVQASREASDARRSQLANLAELWQARIELDRAVGTL